jgi:CubicO group peptidase (beta-lactamase class C family)
MKRNIKTLFVVISFAITFVQTTLAQGLKPGNPALDGFSPERLHNIDSLFNSFTQGHKIAGICAIAVRHGHIDYWHASGYADIANNKLLQRTDMFRIASQTKAITCAAILILYQEGKLVLDDPISKYIPEFKNPTVLKTFNPKDSTYTTEPAKREVTIHDLLTHTSGISYRAIGTTEAKAIYAKAGIPVGFETRHIRLADEMKKLGKLPLVQQPGTAYTYGLNMDVLGYIIEIVSQQSLNDFFRERIFKPLGMNDTYFYVPAEKQSRLSKVFMVNSKGETVENTTADTTGEVNVNYPLTKNGTYYSGGAGLTSTAYDYALFLQMMQNGGILNGKRILSPEIVRLMRINQVGDIGMWYTSNKIGFSFEVVTEKGAADAPWHVGTNIGGGYWGSSYWFDPVSDLVVVIWTQGGGSAYGDCFNKFRAMLYGAMND